MQTRGESRAPGWPDALRQALIEVPCQGCNATVFTMPLAPGARHAYECPRCHAKTYAAVDPALIAGVNQLGAYMAAELTAEGMPGVVIHQRYDYRGDGRLIIA